MAEKHVHASHPAVIARLKRARGHLGAVIEMIEEGRSCLDVAQQMQAVENAIVNAKRAFIHDHVDHCLESDPANSDGLAADRTELKAITRFL